MKYFIYYTLCYLIVSVCTLPKLQAQTKTRSVSFINLPEETEDSYPKSLNRKTIVLNENDFVVLSRNNKSTVSIGRYNADLKKVWQTDFNLQPEATITHFSKNKETAFILTNHKEAGYQQLTAHRIDLNSGKKVESIKLFEAPAKGRKIGVSISEDGSKIVAFEYIMREAAIRAIEAAVFDNRFQKIKTHSYNFREYATSPSVRIRIDNAGNQYVCLLTDYFTKLTIRKYNTVNNEIKVMSVPVGGMFDGRDIFVFQTAYQLTQAGTLYASVMCVDKQTSDYYSLKLVKCDFETDEMRFAPEFKFTPEYIAALNSTGNAEKPITRLEDIELSEIVVSAEKYVTLIAEKRFTQRSEMPVNVAKELHVFTYDEYLNLAWRSVIIKNQSVPEAAGLSNISYVAKLQHDNLELITLEELNGKTDLFLRRIEQRTGKAELPKAFNLNPFAGNSAGYQKDFTAWLDSKTVITVTAQPGKKTTGLLLNKTIFK